MWMDRYVFVVCNKQYASTWTGMLMNSYNSRYVNSWWQCAELPFWQVPFKKKLKKLSLLFLSFNRFILPTWYWSVVAVCCLALLLSCLCVFPVSSGPLYFSSEFCSLHLFILEGADSLVSISGLHPLPGWGPPRDNNVYSSRPWTAGMAAVKNPPSPLFPPPPSGWPWELVNW